VQKCASRNIGVCASARPERSVYAFGMNDEMFHTGYHKMALHIVAFRCSREWLPLPQRRFSIVRGPNIVAANWSRLAGWAHAG